MYAITLLLGLAAATARCPDCACDVGLSAFGERTLADHQIGALIDAQAWELLGLTGQEFRRAWYAGGFKGDSRPELTGLLNLMLNGQWNAFPAGSFS
jgi:hypothetical protein